MIDSLLEWWQTSKIDSGRWQTIPNASNTFCEKKAFHINVNGRLICGGKAGPWYHSVDSNVGTAWMWNSILRVSKPRVTSSPSTWDVKIKNVKHLPANLHSALCMIFIRARLMKNSVWITWRSLGDGRLPANSRSRGRALVAWGLGN